MVDWLTPDRFTHQIHPYPAKLLMHIPHFFLANRVLSQPKDTVLDPFCGSGTVLLEAQLFGRETIGADSNPIARLITKVKTQPLPEDKLRKTLSNVMERIQDKPCCAPPSVINLEYWFYPHVIEQLQRILEAIKTLHNVDIKDFFLICFSVCVRKVSLADPRLAVPVRLCPGQYPKGHWLREKTDAHIRKLRRVHVVKVFHEVVMVNIKRMGRVVARTERSCRDATEELLVVTRSLDENGKMKYDYHLSNAPAETSLKELARVIKAEHRIEDSLKRAKSEAGLSDYEVRTWAGWYHHQTLSLIATWFLICETRRGKKYTLALTVPQVRIMLDMLLRQECDRRYPDWLMHFVKRKSKRRELARFHHYKRHNVLAPLRVTERK